MENEKKEKEMGVNALANMLCGSIGTELTIRKEVGKDEVGISGGTAIAIMDMYLIVKALEKVSKSVLPMMKGPDALRECLHGLVDMMDIGDREEGDEA